MKSRKKALPGQPDPRSSYVMGETQRGEAILRNLAQELLTDLEYRKFKHAVNSFQQTKSVPTLCHQLRPVINTTEKLLLLVELCSRIPRGLREDFHRICSIQFPNYETYLRIYSNDNAMTEIPKVIAQDSSGKFQIVSNGSEKKILVNYNGYKNGDLISQHGTSVTSGVYSENDDLTSLKQVGNDKEDDVFVWTPQYGRIDSSKSAFVTRDSYDGAIRRVFIARRDDGSLGLGIVGGREYGTDIIVSVVDPEGPAAEQVNIIPSLNMNYIISDITLLARVNMSMVFFFNSSVSLEKTRSFIGFFIGLQKNCDIINLKIVNFGLT